MPFQPVNFAGIAPLGNPAMRNFVDSLMKGYAAAKMPAQMGREAEAQELANAFARMRNQQEPQAFESKLASEAAQRAATETGTEFMKQGMPLELEALRIQNEFTPQLNQSNLNLSAQQLKQMEQMGPLRAQELMQRNKYYPEFIQSQIDAHRQQAASSKALADQRALGGVGLGVGGREEMFFQKLVAQDNPELSAEQAYEASNILRAGGTVMADGTPIKFSPASRASFDRLVKYGTTGTLITQAKAAEQAEREIDVLSKYIVEAVSPYGDTFNGYSPKQIMDTFSPKKEDQIRLGRLAASQQLQTDLAAIQNKLNSGQSTATITNEILDRSEALIKTKWPRMSGIARQEAMRYLKEALQQGFEARRSVELGASTFQNMGQGGAQKHAPVPTQSGQPGAPTTPKRLRFNPTTGGFE